MKHLFTLSEWFRAKWERFATLASSAMPFLKATKRQSDTTIFAKSLKSLMSIFSSRGVMDVRLSLGQYPTDIQRISNLYLTPNRFFTRFAAVFALVFVMGVGNVWGVEGTEHDFTDGAFSQLLNNNASLSGKTINIAAQSYPIKEVKLVGSYNKSITHAVTISVSVGGNSWGSQYVESNSSYSKIFATNPVSSVIGAVSVSFVNNTGDGTGHGTFNVTKVVLVEGGAATPATIALNNYSGNTSTSGYNVGQNFTLPSTNDYICGTKTFVGWSTVEIATTNTKPTNNFHEPGASVTLAGSNTFYAVFADEEEGDPEWSTTTLASLTNSDVFVFAVNVSGTYYAMPNNGGTSSAPSLASITVSNNKITSTVANNLKWNISGNATNGYVFYPNGSSTTWMYCNTTATSKQNDNIRVGTGSRKAWKVNNDGYLYNDDVTGGTRYFSRNGTSDFRSYLNTGTNPVIPVIFKYGSGTTYSNYATSCCTELAQINGSINLSHF